jgi:hypothetical protein
MYTITESSSKASVKQLQSSSKAAAKHDSMERMYTITELPPAPAALIASVFVLLC